MRTATSLLFALALLLVTTGTVRAQEVSTPGPLDVLGGLAEGIGDAVADAFSRVFREWWETWWPIMAVRGFLAVVGAVAEWMAFNFRGAIGTYDIITRTPARWVTENPLVVDMWEKSRWIANVFLAVALIRNAYLIMSADVGSVSKADAKGRIGKVLFSAIYSNVSLFIWSLALGINNAICAYFQESGTLPGAESLPTEDLNTINGLMTIFYVIWSVRLFISMVVRLAIVDVAVILSPFAIILNTIPEGRPYHDLWQKFGFGTLFSQVIVVILLAIGTSFIGASLLPGDSMGPGIAQLLIGLGVMEVALRAPTAIGKMLFGAGSYQGGGMRNSIVTTAAVAAGTVGVARTAATRMAAGR